MSGRSHWGAGLGGSGVRGEARLESGGERWHSREDEQKQEGEEERRGVSRWMGPDGELQLRLSVVAQLPANSSSGLRFASVGPPANGQYTGIRCLMRLDSCPYSAANSRQMPRLGDAAPSECDYGLYLAWHLGLALLRGIRLRAVKEQRQLATERQAGI